jgi:hypothetical protein
MADPGEQGFEGGCTITILKKGGNMFNSRRKRLERPTPKLVAGLYEAERQSRVRLSRWLARRAHRMGRARLIGFCLGLMVCGGAFFGWTIVENLRAAGWVVKLPTVVAPKILDVVQEKKHPREPSEFNRRYDSLMRHNPVLRHRMDSLLKARPGLADTVRWLKEN